VFRPNNGTWYSALSGGGAKVEQWGLSGDVPVNEDFDGDGKDDPAIWRPGNGIWAVLRSTRGFRRDLNAIVFMQWGLFGDQPMPGDYTGDGKADLAVWRPSDGTWYVCPSDSGFDCTQAMIQQFGLPGDYPVKGDFDGDGVLDFAIWRQATASWFYRSSANGSIHSQQWGFPTDLPACYSPIKVAEFSQ
jgi:hypothetical protein